MDDRWYKIRGIKTVMFRHVPKVILDTGRNRRLSKEYRGMKWYN